MKQLFSNLGDLWSSTSFGLAEVDDYAGDVLMRDARNGVTALGLVSLCLLLGAAALYYGMGYNAMYIYTCGLLALLSGHVTLSAWTVRETRVLYLLSMALLVVSGCAFVLLAHKTGTLNPALMASVVLLFMVVPTVPWGMREALLVVLLIYLVFTLSTLSVDGRFDAESLWILQFLMLGSALASLTVVARNVGVRKDDIRARFELESAHDKLERLSYIDGLTGAWNRRFLNLRFVPVLEGYREANMAAWFVLLDVDDFKSVNDNHGHDYGDGVLQFLVEAFQGRLGDDNYVIRLGGDEFALMMGGEEPETRIHSAMLRMQERVWEEFGRAKPEIRVSVGIMRVADKGVLDIEHIYKKADEALYQAKSGKHETETPAHCVGAGAA